MLQDSYRGIKRRDAIDKVSHSILPLSSSVQQIKHKPTMSLLKVRKLILKTLFF